MGIVLNNKEGSKTSFSGRIVRAPDNLRLATFIPKSNQHLMQYLGIRKMMFTLHFRGGFAESKVYILDRHCMRQPYFGDYIARVILQLMEKTERVRRY